MLRIRATDGKLVDIDTTYRFVELCDLEGRVAKLFYTDSMGVVHESDANSPEALRYQKAFKVEFVPVKSANL